MHRGRRARNRDRGRWPTSSSRSSRGKEFEALWTLRALAKGVELDDALIEAETGVPLSTWRELMDRMKRARYGVIFFGFKPTDVRSIHINVPMRSSPWSAT